jgi:hypothetical protein
VAERENAVYRNGMVAIKLFPRIGTALVVLSGLVAAAGCNRSPAGRYVGEARLMAGKSESPDYSLETIRARLSKDPRTLVLNADGTYRETFGSTDNLGTWEVRAGKLELLSTTVNGVQVQPALQSVKRYQIIAGEIIAPDYTAYNVDLVFRKE